MITLEKLALANEGLPVINYERFNKKSGKKESTDYVQVHTRVDAFRSMCPGGSILTEFIVLEEDRAVCKATVRDEDGHVLATGHAEERRSGQMANSFVEVCETSSVGRALGFLGVGIKTGIASAEEIQHAEEAAEKERIEAVARQEIGEFRAGCLAQELENRGIPEDFILGLYKVPELSKLTERMHSNIGDNWKNIEKLYKERK